METIDFIENISKFYYTGICYQGFKPNLNINKHSTNSQCFLVGVKPTKLILKKFLVHFFKNNLKDYDGNLISEKFLSYLFIYG